MKPKTISQLEKFLAESDVVDQGKNGNKMRIRAMVGQYEVAESVIKVEVVKAKGYFCKWANMVYIPVERS